MQRTEPGLKGSMQATRPEQDEDGWPALWAGSLKGVKVEFVKDSLSHVLRDDLVRWSEATRLQVCNYVFL